MSDSIVHVEHLSHDYGQRLALNDVSFDVRPGEIFGFLGPNGSGKTTLFRILSTLMAPQQGRVTMLGQDLHARRDEIRKHIGVVFQAPSLDKQLTAYENLMHHGHLYGLRGKALEQRIDEMLARVNLSDRPTERVGQFSGGMRRRVELAKGLLNRPKILLLDEPSTGLDPGARIDLWRYLREIRDADGTTILVTTHLMDEAEHCSRLAIMHQGKMLACDTPEALKGAIGGDVITLSSPAPAQLKQELRNRFAVEADEVDDTLRIERERGHEFIPELIESFPGQINSVSLGKPTLEDVFIRVTGHGLRQAPEPTPAAKGH
jgi:ABC-2 type transport system ATP-binding protein